jgi:hypothetical protein
MMTALQECHSMQQQLQEEQHARQVAAQSSSRQQVGLGTTVALLRIPSNPPCHLRARIERSAQANQKHGRMDVPAPRGNCADGQHPALAPSGKQAAATSVLSMQKLLACPLAHT